MKRLVVIESKLATFYSTRNKIYDADNPWVNYGIVLLLKEQLEIHYRILIMPLCVMVCLSSCPTVDIVSFKRKFFGRR